ncbi:putative allophanate hydrolase subunit 1 [Pectobacterium atrosepticum SCRI1043]|uniref:Allophanate hydrolase subunit 1 n=1 Tax=Pectobacterium atrosepticum (strain SCRI 1043 / ATCC BAA-672) TaxID=218491 RepID=Q6CYL9_PECAS|nr:5-oxoprolinase subunit PxpB [Pectobacterium atrosepticum]GKV87928.1 allophanate hydrolase [Pectobacterium carotovorum subsp. carotovorum]ATY92906.1 allophanate hydrolase subunit 1 [Pectobacterium atrosepticum]KFX17481.1 allophanate hydrolase [Pectobacterium atrosepticum]KFX22903.1 allophanate hydrolase [Pectobacterium atrosepticum]KMK82170.1 putative allophanate hydrolase subunit 1 [Pectobacterium atrosepticum ICMP 1526]
MGLLAHDLPMLNKAENVDTVKLSTMGSRAWLVEAPGEFSLAVQRRIWSLAQMLAERDEVESLIPGVTNLLVLLRVTPDDPDDFPQRLRCYWQQASEIHSEGKRIDIPVTYGGELASDLDDVCRHTGFSAKEVIRRHYQGNYTVFALGSAPGFGYLHGLDPLLATPRKKVPSLNMLKGTVTIGGPQTGVSVLTGPNGWNAIGFADLAMFDPLADSPALMAPGDTIRFIPQRIEL